MDAHVKQSTQLSSRFKTSNLFASTQHNQISACLLMPFFYFFTITVMLTKYIPLLALVEICSIKVAFLQENQLQMPVNKQMEQHGNQNTITTISLHTPFIVSTCPVSKKIDYRRIQMHPSRLSQRSHHASILSRFLSLVNSTAQRQHSSLQFMWPEYEEIINAQTSPLSCAM